MDQIECSHCHRQCIPKLWHYRPAFGGLRYMATQHICPFCGGVMYQTGGQLNFFGWIAAIFFGAIFGIGIVAQFMKSKDIVEVITFAGSILFWGFIIYKLYKRFSR